MADSAACNNGRKAAKYAIFSIFLPWRILPDWQVPQRLHNGCIFSCNHSPCRELFSAAKALSYIFIDRFL